MSIELKGKGAPSCVVTNSTLVVTYGSAEDYTARVSGDDAVIRKAVKVVAAEVPPSLPGHPIVVHYTIAG